MAALSRLRMGYLCCRRGRASAVEPDAAPRWCGACRVWVSRCATASRRLGLVVCAAQQIWGHRAAGSGLDTHRNHVDDRLDGREGGRLHAVAARPLRPEARPAAGEVRRRARRARDAAGVGEEVQGQRLERRVAPATVGEDGGGQVGGHHGCTPHLCARRRCSAQCRRLHGQSIAPITRKRDKSNANKKKEEKVTEVIRRPQVYDHMNNNKLGWDSPVRLGNLYPGCANLCSIFCQILIMNCIIGVKKIFFCKFYMVKISICSLNINPYFAFMPDYSNGIFTMT